MSDRPDESPAGVDLDALRDWFPRNVPGASDAPLHAELIAGGRSNLTYSISDGSNSWVLRRQPLGHVLPTAHDMAREFKVLSALADTDVPVPRTYALCEDETVNGGPFYVMERVDGVILRTPDEIAGLSETEARRCGTELMDVLGAIHAVDYDQVGLGDFGRPDGYLERQVRRWGEQWERSQTRELPEIEELARRLRAAIPVSPPPTIVHGDYRLDNTMLDPNDPGRIVAVLDWEMATLGDPLADLGLFLVYYGRNGVESVAGAAPIANSGFPTRDEIVDHYAQITGAAMDDLDFYEVLAMYKLAIIIEGIHARFLKGKTLGDGFSGMGEIVEHLVNAALAIAAASPMTALHG